MKTHRIFLGTALTTLIVALGAGCGGESNPTTSSGSSTGAGQGGGGQGGDGQGGDGGQGCVPATESCDGADNDCDGDVDEGCDCLPGDTQTCYSGPAPTQDVGACTSGLQTCDADGHWGSCDGEVLPSAETCDGADNDCNMTTDDNVPEVGTACQTGQMGVCDAGTQDCVTGALTCIANMQPSPETCDTLDNDCDGQVDNGNPGGGMTCDTGMPGVCGAGTTACTNGAVVCNQNVQSSAEMCDGLDNDCDSAVDDGNPGSGMTCDTGMPGVCGAGTTACTNGAVVCNQNVQSSAEMCDGFDNDCDSVVDDGNPGGGMSCSTGLPGVCGAGTTACTNGAVVCNQNVQSSAETCDGLDNDCDSVVDNGNPGGGMACSTGQQGACAAGTSMCANGIVVCNQTVQPALEVCDNVDNNCNGQLDEVNSTGATGTCSHNKCVTGAAMTGACDACVAVVCADDPYCCTTSWDSLCVDEVESECNVQCTGGCTTGQPGVCSAGTDVCTNGSLTCTQTTLPSAEACDGLDNNCNSQVDDGNPGGGVSCSTGLGGACAAGVTQCTAGAIECTLLVSPTTEICADGLDQDCDGLTDTFCACAHSGCFEGVLLTSACDPCVALICADDDYCCDTEWDDICVGEATSICGLTCP